MIFNIIFSLMPTLPRNPSARFCLAAFLAVAFLFPPLLQAGEITDRSPRFLVHLLDYLVTDYAGAVKDGKVLSASEYQEQQEFAAMALELGRTLPELRKSPETRSMIERLDGLIAHKADPAQVAALARQTADKIITLTGIPLAPLLWPDQKQGRMLYGTSCVACHGLEGRGDGPSAKSLSGQPPNFLQPGDMSPFKAYNAIRLGVPGTPMPSFPGFSDQQAWELAFYVASLRYQSQGAGLTPGDFAGLRKALGYSPQALLEKTASSSDPQLLDLLPGSPDEKARALMALRLYSPEQSELSLLAFAQETLRQSLENYGAGKVELAHAESLKAYLEGVEPAEPKLRASDLKTTSDLEEVMGRVRNQMASHAPPALVAASGQEALETLAKAMGLLQNQSSSPWITFVLAFGIFLREGFEASLIIVALLGVLKGARASRAARWVHAGWISALGLGLAAWFISGMLIVLSGAGRELLEAVTGSVTILVLLYLGFWLHSRTEIGRWNHFIKTKVQSALEGSNLKELFAIAFLAAFREAFETVLFLRAVWLGGGAQSKAALLAGVLSAFALILFLSWLLLRFSARLPLKSIFTVSSLLMVALAVLLAGESIHSFQEVDVLAIHPFPLNLHFDWLGLYPTWETLLAQILILSLSLALWAYGKRPSPRK
jgi:high-affinity iron transporter